MTASSGIGDIDHDASVDMEISAPPPSYASNQMPSRLKSFFINTTNTNNNNLTPEQPVAFTVPNDFDLPKVQQKGFKSNSWFSSPSLNQTDKVVRRVVSAPNAKLLNMTKQQQQQQQNGPNHQPSFHSLRLRGGINSSSMAETTDASSTSSSGVSNGSSASIPAVQHLRSCRRTYSSSSIKVKQVEVGPSSFSKIRMLGKGDVGKVYMVRQKQTDKLFAMKGTYIYSEGGTKSIDARSL